MKICFIELHVKIKYVKSEHISLILKKNPAITSVIVYIKKTQIILTGRGYTFKDKIFGHHVDVCELPSNSIM